MLTQEEKLDILREFPNIKLSYEKIIHKKVYEFDLLLGIPDGKKCFVWFTSFKNNMICILLELDNISKKEFKNIRIVNCCFSSQLCYGTLFFGTLFYHMNNPFFSIEDIHLYKGKDVSSDDFICKINRIANILKNDIKQISYNKNFIVFGLPIIISNNNEDFDKRLTTISYKLHSIKYIKNNSHFTLSFDDFKSDVKESVRENIKENVRENIKENVKDFTKERKSITKQEKIFICKPDIQNDIYHLYTSENDYIGLAAIPDYKTSVMMNNLFRIIKENQDLDALEESDDEEEFENSNIDKFVYLEKTYKMICIFNNKFKKWVPIKITQ
jgi:hypothetical protein